MVQGKRIQSNHSVKDIHKDRDDNKLTQEAGHLFALMTAKRPVSRRNRASWYLRQLNKVVRCEEVEKNNLGDNSDRDTSDFEDNPMINDRDRETSQPNSTIETRKRPHGNNTKDNDNPMNTDPACDPDLDAAELVHKDIHLISIIAKQSTPNQNSPLLGDSLNLGSETHNTISLQNRKPATTTTAIDDLSTKCDKFLVTPQTRVLYLSKSIASSIILDLSPSIVSVSSHSGCIYSDIIFDALRITMNLFVRSHEIPTSIQAMKPYVLQPKIYVSVIAYSPFMVAKNNQVLVQNRRISSANIDQVLAELLLNLEKLFVEIQDLISSSSGPGLDFGSLGSRNVASASLYPAHLTPGNMLRHPSEVLDDILELGIFSTSLLPKLSRRSVVIISDGHFSYTNNLAVHRLKNIALSFVSLCDENTYPDACFGYTSSVDLMKFIAMSTQGFHITYERLRRFFDDCGSSSSSDLAADYYDYSYQTRHQSARSTTRSTSCIPNEPLNFIKSPLKKLFSWTLHCNTGLEGVEEMLYNSALDDINPIRVLPEQISRFFCADRPLEMYHQEQYDATTSKSNAHQQLYGHHDWKVFRHMKRNLDADFEQVLSCLLREGYLIKSIQFKHKEVSKIVAKLVLHWRHNLDLERELTAPYWSNIDPFEMAEVNRQQQAAAAQNNQNSQQAMQPRKQSSALVYGNTNCEVLVHGSYSFLLNLFADKSRRRSSEYRDQAYKQFKQLIEGVSNTHDRLQYLSRYYKDASVSMVPSFLLHGNSLLYEQPHTHKLTMMVENVADEQKTSDFQEYWQKLSYLDARGWKNLMHIHTIRLILEHDQPKFKNIHFQNVNGRYTHVQCRRAMSALSNFIKSYASFALLEDSTYVKFISHQASKLPNQDDLGEVENSATKGFFVIRVIKSLPILVMKLMFTSGIPDSCRIDIVSNLEKRLLEHKLRNTPAATDANPAAPSPTPQVNTSSNNNNNGLPINILKTRTIAASGDTCCTIIKSPLETMLRVYHRNFVSDFLRYNWSHGLPGSCPISAGNNTLNHQSQLINNNKNHHQAARLGNVMTGKSGLSTHAGKDESNCVASVDSGSLLLSDSQGSDNRVNLVLGKCLSGIRVIVTISDMPSDVISSLAANVLSKICALMVNTRIRQGFRIAFNNSGILNLVVELTMEDHSFEGEDKSNCLTQCILFPPTILNEPSSQIKGNQQQLQQTPSATLATPDNAADNSTTPPPAQPMSSSPIVDSASNAPALHHQQQHQHNPSSVTNASSKPSSLSGSFSNNATIDSYLQKNTHDSSQESQYNARNTVVSKSSPQQQNLNQSQFLQSEIKFIREYWIEQQYGISSTCSHLYHDSLANKRFPEVIEHLYQSDRRIFECLLTYDLLQLLCDKMSPYYNLDENLSKITHPTPSSGVAKQETDKLHERRQRQSQSKSQAGDKGDLPAANDDQQTLLSQIAEDGWPNNNHHLDSEHSHSRSSSQVSLIEMEYKFCITNFLDFCQLASLNMLLFQDRSDYFEPSQADDTHQQAMGADQLDGHRLSTHLAPGATHSQQQQHHTLHRNDTLPNMSNTLINNNCAANAQLDDISRSLTSGNLMGGKREHRYSYQSEAPTINSTATGATTFMNLSSTYATLNHLFLETVQKRLKQIHEKELKLPQYDKVNLAIYLRKRLLKLYQDEHGGDLNYHSDSDGDAIFQRDSTDTKPCFEEASKIEWRCFLRKGNQDNQMIVVIPASMGDIHRWVQFLAANQHQPHSDRIICPIFVFRCSSSLVNDRLLRFLNSSSQTSKTRTTASPNDELGEKITKLESDLTLHLGQSCRHLGKLHALNDELLNDLPGGSSLDLQFSDSAGNLSSLAGTYSAQTVSSFEAKVMESTHFKAFLRKIKNTVLKSRFSSLSDAYTGLLFILKEDLKYYMENVDGELQKKYHVSGNLRSVSDFVELYAQYQASLPAEPVKPINPLLTSILLQKCGIFTNLPVARFNESDPLMQQLHDKKLVFFMRSNYPIELPVLTESLSHSSTLILRDLVKAHQQQQQMLLLSQLTGGGAGAFSGSNASGTPTTTTTASHAHQQQHHASLTSNSPGGFGVNINGANAGGNNNSGQRHYGSSFGSSPSSGSYMERLRRVQQLQQARVGILGANMEQQAQMHHHHHHHHHHHQQQQYQQQLSFVQAPINDLLILEAFRGPRSCSMREVPNLGGLSGDENIAIRQELHLAEMIRRNAVRKESHQYRRVLKSKANYSQSHSVIDQALKRVDKLGRLEHFCLTPLLFSPAWRSKLAPVRDHTIESSRKQSNNNYGHSDADQQQARTRHRYNSYDNTISGINFNAEHSAADLVTPGSSFSSNGGGSAINSHLQAIKQQQRDESDERWHQIVCNNYLKEYEQYIQTLGFNSIQVRYQQQHYATPSSATTTHFSAQSPATTTPPSSTIGSRANNTKSGTPQTPGGASSRSSHLKRRSGSSSSQRRHSNSTSAAAPQASGQNQPMATPTVVASGTSTLAGLSSQGGSSGPAYNTGYLIKFLNSGCLVFKVGFCKPYVYSVLYSIEGERFNNCQTKSSMTAFLDELDNIKLTMHLHSFTYDYHLRTIFSYISGRQLSLLSPGYHLISFLGEFLKYYQKAPNYARNHILCDSISLDQLRVAGPELYKYLVERSKTYKFEVAEMSQSASSILQHNSGSSNSATSGASKAAWRAMIQESKSAEQYSLRNNNADRNDHVLIELKREKIRHQDASKEPNLFDCGLLVTHDYDPESREPTSTLKLKYFLLLTNQRDLYPKLVHTHGMSNVINFGCHRPIRMTNKYLVERSKTYKFEVAEMSQSASSILQHNSGSSNSATSGASKAAWRAMIQESKSAEQYSLRNNNADRNDHVLIELKREKIRHQDASKEPNLFDCGLLVTHDYDPESREPTSTLKLKYFLLLTNQRDLYPKLVHTHGMSNVINFGCHRPIRMTKQQQLQLQKRNLAAPSDQDAAANLSRSNSTVSRDGSRNNQQEEDADLDELASSELMSSSQDNSRATSGPPSIDSSLAPKNNSNTLRTTAPSDQALLSLQLPSSGATNKSLQSTTSSNGPASLGSLSPKLVHNLKAPDETRKVSNASDSAPTGKQTAAAPPEKANETPQAALTLQQQGSLDRTICDEEITYLGYFSTDEMDMLRFLQEKAASLRLHIEQVVRSAEVHYRRDFLWAKLMQLECGNKILNQVASPTNQAHSAPLTSHSLISPLAQTSTHSFDSINASGSFSTCSTSVAALGELTSSPAGAAAPTTMSTTTGQQHQAASVARSQTEGSWSSPFGAHNSQAMLASHSGDLCLSADELVQLLAIVESVDLARLDPQLSGFASMHINWYVKLLRAFTELKQLPNQQHKIFIIRAHKILVLFMDPKCLQAFILLSIDADRCSAEMSLLLRDRAESSPRPSGNSKQQQHSKPADSDSSRIELDVECQRLVEDFVNFCATFMWSTFLQ